MTTRLPPAGTVAVWGVASCTTSVGEAGLVPVGFVAVAVIELLPEMITPTAKVAVYTPGDDSVALMSVPLTWNVTVVPGPGSADTVSVGVVSPVKLSFVKRPVSDVVARSRFDGVVGTKPSN